MPTLQKVKQQLRIEDDYLEEDNYLNHLIEVSIAQIENDTNQAITEKQVELIIDNFEPVIELPIFPVKTINEIEYIDIHQNTQVLNSSNYYVDLRNKKAVITEKETYPVTSNIPQSIKITYTVGQEMPKTLEHAALMLISHWYANREAVTAGASNAVPLAYQSLIQPHKVYL